MKQIDYLEIAEHYYKTNNPKRALEELKKVANYNHKFYYLSAQCYFDLSQFEKAKKALLEGLIDSPDDLYLLFLLVNTQRRLGQYKNAEKYVKQVRSLFPERADVLELYAKVMLDLRNYPAMHAAYIEAIKIRGESPNSLLNASVALMYGKPKTAIKHIEQDLSQNPERAYTHSIAAQAYENDWQLDKYLEHALMAARLEPEQSYYRYQAYRAKVMTDQAYKPLTLIYAFNHKFAAKPAYLVISIFLLLWALGIAFEQNVFSLIITIIGFGFFGLLFIYWLATNLILKYLFRKMKTW